MGRAVYILYLPAPAPTIFYRAITDDVDGFTLLGWLLGQLRERLAGQELVILCHPGIDERLAHRHADPLRIPVLTAASGTRLAALGDLALALGGRPIVAFFPEIAFAPAGILTAVLAHHIQAENHYTAVKGLPYGVAPEVFDASLLTQLGRVAFDGPAPDLTLAVQQLLLSRPGKLRAVSYSVPPVAGFEETPVLSIETALDVRRARHCLLAKTDPPLAEWQTAPEPFEPAYWPDAGPEVLYVSPWSGYSGAEECLRWLSAGLGRTGLRQAALLGVEDVLAERLREAGVQVYCANWQFERDSPSARAFTAQALDGLRPRLIHCNTDAGPDLYAAAAERAIPVVTHIRMPQLSAYRNAIAHSTRLIAVSGYVRDLLLADGVDPSRVELIYDGVDAERFQPSVLAAAAMRREFGFQEEDFLVLMVARQVPEKRHDLLLRAAAEARAVLPNLRIAFVGNQGRAQYQRELALLERELRVSDIVRWFPFQADIRRMEAAADTLVLCSEREALGTCVLEAMALGKPVIVSDGYGPKEMVEPGVNGLHVTQGSAGALRDAIVALADDPECRAAMGAAARQEFLRRFTLDSHTARVAALFGQLSV
jgi:glycosyltransferase involved in cell wall biosynthesis